MLVLDSGMLTPPACAGPLIVRVPWDEVPPFTEVGDSVNETGSMGLTVRAAVLLTPANVALMVAVVGDVTESVLTVKVPTLAPGPR